MWMPLGDVTFGKIGVERLVMVKSKAVAVLESKKKKKKKTEPVVQSEEEEEEQPLDPLLEDEDDEDDEDEDEDDGDDEENEDEDEDEDEDENEDEENENDESTNAQCARKAKARRNQRAKARNVTYRKWAGEAGLSVGKRSFASDIVKAVISPADVRRMAHFCSQIADGGVELGEFKERIRLRDASLSSGPLAVLHTSVESFARNAAKELVTRSLESTTSRITASNVRSVLRNFEDVSDFDFVCPLGVVRHAQTMQKLKTTEDDEAKRVEESKFAKANHAKILKEADREREVRKAEAHAKRVAAKEKRAESEAVAVCV